MRYSYLPTSEAAHTLTVAPPRPAPAPEYRIITAARELTAAEWRRLPDVSRIAALMSEAGATHEGTTYAMAEEIATATLVESVALRFQLADGRRGAAVWWDWSWHGAIVRELGVLTRERLELLITTGSAEVPLYACQRCGREGLKRNKDQTLRAHKRAVWHPPLTEACK